MYKWILLFLTLPAIAFGQWRNDSHDNPNATSSGWGDISKAPFKIHGVNVGAGDLSVLFSVNPLKPDSNDYSIILRVGDRAQSTGDSRMGIYSSSWINTHRNPALESQAIYGINLYRGDSLDGKDGYDATATQIGVHGIAQARYGATDSAAGLVGVQGFASSFSDGHINWMYGGSFNAQGGDPSNASIGTLGGVRANAYVEGYDTVSQASAFIGMAPTIGSMLGGQIIHAWTAQLEQPSVGTTSNYALVFTDPTPLTGDDDISIGFRDSSGSIKTFSFDQRTHEFQILRYLTIYEPLDGLTSYLKLVHGDTAGVGESNSGIYFTAQDSVDVGAANQFSIVHRWGNGNNQLEFIKGSNIVFSIYPTYLLANSPLYKYAFLADSQYVTKHYADGLGGGVSLTDVGNYVDSTQLDTIQYAHQAVYADSAGDVTDGTIDSADIGSGVIYNPHIANSTITPFKLNDVNTQTDLMLLGQDTATTNFRWYWIDELLGLEPNATTGYVLHIDKEADPDSLYWALAGGSGNPIKIDTGGVLTLVDSLIVEAGNDIDLAVDIAAGFDKLTIKLDTTGFISLADFPDSVLRVVRDSLGGTSTRTDNYVLKIDVTPTPDTFYWGADNTGGGGGIDSADVMQIIADSTIQSSDIANQTITKDDIDTTANFVFGAAYKGTSLVAGNQFVIGSDFDKIADDTASFKGKADSSIQVIAGNGLTGGGNLQANRTLAVGAGTGITVNADDIATTLGTSIGTAEIEAGAVDSTKIAAGVIDSTHIQNGEIAPEDLRNMTSAELAAKITNETGSAGTGVAVFSASPELTGTLLADSGQFDGNVDIDSMDVNGAADFTGTTTVGTVAGAIDAGGATSLEIPNGNNPTTDATGEIAQDANNNAIEVYIPSETESGLIPVYKEIVIPLILPDSIQAYVPNLFVYKVSAALYPFGIEVDSVFVRTNVVGTYSMEFEEWSGADPAVYENLISTLSPGGANTYAIEAPDTDGNLNAGDWIVLDIPAATTRLEVTVGIIFHVTEGN